MAKRNRVFMLGLSILLAACSASGTSAPGETDAAAPASTAGATPAQGELSTLSEDMLGIFRLEDSKLAVDTAQAAALLPLWQAYRTLLQSETAASAELEALVAQIDATLTAEQKNAIAEMKLTPQDLFAVAEELGVSQSPMSGEGANSSSDRPFVQGGGASGVPGGAGGPPSGGMPPSGGFPGGEMPEGFDPSMLAQGTPQSGQGGMGRGGDRFSLGLLDPLIELLKERAGS